MLIALLVGVLSGVLGVASWTLAQLVLSSPTLHGQLADHWFIVPLFTGVIAAILYGSSSSSTARARGEKRQAFHDIFESYHLGIVVLKPMQWIARGVVSLLGAFFGGVFGAEGGLIELCYAAFPALSKVTRLFIQEKQTFVLCTIAACLGVTFGTPFSGAILALEMIQAQEIRVRSSSVLAALIAFGTATLLKSTAIPSVFGELQVERFSILNVMFGGLRDSSLESAPWFQLSFAAIGLGVLCGIFSLLNSRVLSKCSEVCTELFGENIELRMLVTGAALALAVWLAPQAYHEPWRVWEDVASLRLSSREAFGLLIASWSLLVLAFSGWGSVGLFSPMLTLGALGGYALGNSVGSGWALPLAIAGAASTLAASFAVPVAAAGLVLEIGHHGPVWWLSSLSVIAAALTMKLFKGRAVYDAILNRNGMRLIGGRAANLLSSIQVSDAMNRDFQTIHDLGTLEELKTATQLATHGFLAVVSTEKKYLGLLPLEHLPARVRRVLHVATETSNDSGMGRTLEIRDLVDSYSPTVLPTDTLETALPLLSQTPCLAVVDTDGRICGMLFEESLAGRYKLELIRTVSQQS